MLNLNQGKQGRKERDARNHGDHGGDREGLWMGTQVLGAPDTPETHNAGGYQGCPFNGHIRLQEKKAQAMTDGTTHRTILQGALLHMKHQGEANSRNRGEGHVSKEIHQEIHSHPQTLKICMESMMPAQVLAAKSMAIIMREMPVLI